MSSVTDLRHRQPVGLVAENTVDFVRRAFTVLSAGRVLALIRDERDVERKSIACVTETQTCHGMAGWYEGDAPRFQSADALAQVLFTSGTEGPSKAVALTAGALENTAERLVDVMEMDATIREYVGVPVYMSFGFGRCRAVAKCGGKFYVPPHGFDVLEIERMLRRGEINAVSAVPTLWRLVLANPELYRQVGRRMRWIEIGSQWMAADEKERLRAMFPNAVIVQHYGLTEASRSTFLPIHAAPAELLASVGRPSAGGEVRIGEGGRISVKGAHLADWIFEDGDWARVASDDGWLATSDAGHLDDSGWLYFDGRLDDLINCGGTKLSPDQIEQQIKRLLGHEFDVGVARIADPIRGDGILVARTADCPVDSQVLRQTASSVVSSMGVDAGFAIRCEEFESLPVTSSGKLQRKALAVAFENSRGIKRRDASQPLDVPVDSVERFLGTCFADLQGTGEAGPDTEFFSGGVDSLAAVELITRVYAEYAVELTLADLLEARRLRDIAKKIRWLQCGGTDRAYRYVVPLSGRLSDAPMFIVGGAYGNVLHLHDLAAGLAGEAGVYGLQYPGLQAGEDPVDNIPEIASRFISEITTMTIGRRIRLAGYSGGGIIAAEMARQLIDDGIDVSYFAMIDSRLPRRPPYEESWSVFERQSVRAVRLLRNRRRYANQARQLLEGMLRRAPRTESQSAGQSSPARERSVKVHAAFHRGLNVYEIPRLPLQLYYYRPGEERRYRIGRNEIDFVEGEPHRIDRYCNGWDSFFDTAVSVVVPGDHYSLVVPPNARALAAAMVRDIGRTS